MRARVAVFVGVVAVAAASALGCAASTGSGGHATLRLVSSSPLTVRGVHFRSHERVRVTAGARTVRATAGSNGGFVVTIRGADRCNVTRLLARGSAGSYVVLKMLPSPECLPARSS